VDWNKTKNILILTLLLMNVFLIYTIYFKDVPQSSDFDYDSVVALLGDRNVDITNLKVRHYETLPRFELTKAKISLSETTALKDAGFELYEKEDTLGLGLALEEGDQREFDQILETLLSILGADAEHRTLIYDRTLGSQRQLLFNQCERGFCFDDGFLEVSYIEGEIFQATYQWLRVKEQGGIYEENIYPFEKAVLNLIEFGETFPEKREIVDFQIVYRVEDQENLKTDSITASYPSPFWRGITADGEKIFIDGLR